MLSVMETADSLDPYALESRWRGIAHIRAMPGLDHEMHAVDAERLEAEQGAIQWRFRTERPADTASRRWSGTVRIGGCLAGRARYPSV
jgi:hypothetical protein